MREWLADLLGRIGALLRPASVGTNGDDASRVTRVLTVGTLALVLPLLGLAVYASSATQPPGAAPLDDFWRRVAAAVLAPSGPLAIGSLVGFLFGIPRSARRDSKSGASDGDEGKSSGTDRLDELSEWGVKLLLGAGLTQLGWLYASFEGTARRLSLALGAQPSAQAIAWTILAYFLAWGFFAGFLATRLWLLGELKRVDRIQQLQARLQDEQERGEIAAERAKGAEEKLSAVADASVQVLEASRAERSDAAAADERPEGPMQRFAADPVKARKTVESLVFSALYQAAPEGFRKAILTAEEYLRQHASEEAANADLNTYLACAHGQAHAYEKARAARTDVLRRHHDGALEAAEAAIRGAPETRDLLRAFLKAGPGEIDNDLASFAGDPAFEALLAEPKP